MVKTMLKSIFTLMFFTGGYYLFIACTEPEVGDPNAPCTGEIIRDLTFGIVNVATVPNWCNVNDPASCITTSRCLEEPSHNKYKSAEEQARRLIALVSEEAYTEFGKTFWFQYGVDGQTICSDDNVNNEYNANCLKVENVNYSCPQLVWVQMMSECDNCVDGGAINGSWWKFEQLFQPDRLPLGLCSAARDGEDLDKGNSMITSLAFRGRVQCLGLNFEYGCEDDEISE